MLLQGIFEFLLLGGPELRLELSRCNFRSLRRKARTGTRELSETGMLILTENDLGGHRGPAPCLLEKVDRFTAQTLPCSLFDGAAKAGPSPS